MAFEKRTKYRSQRDNLENLRRCVEGIKRIVAAGGGGPSLTTIEALLTSIDTDQSTAPNQALILTELISILAQVTTNATEAKQNDIIAELQDIDANTINNATEAKQNDIITAINNQIDYEVLQCYGRDSNIYNPFLHIAGTPASTQYQGGASPAPTLQIVPSRDSLGIVQTNSNYYVEFDIEGDLSATNAIDIFLDATMTAGASMIDVVIELRDTVGSTLLDTTTVLSSAGLGTLETANLTYDNTSVNYSFFTIRLIPTGFIATPSITTFYDNFLILDSSITNPVTAIISKVDKYEDNALVSTNYFDYLGASYALIGTFIKDNSLLATELIRDSLSTIETNTADISKLLAHNTHSSFILPLGALPTAFVGWKELSFAVLTGTVDVGVGISPNVTYPIALASGGNLVGQTLIADDITTSGVAVDPTLGDVLITIKT